MDKKVLLLDDMEASLRLMKTHCKEIGIETVFTATVIKEAKEILSNDLVDLIICDQFLSIGTGTFFLEELKKDDRTKNIPFILITANNESDVILDALEKGADAYIEKPYNFEEFENKVVRLLKG